MIIKLGAAGPAYVKALFDAWRARIEDAFSRCHVKGEDIDVGQTKDGDNNLVSVRLILRDRVTGTRYAVVIDSGVLDIELIP